MRKEKTKMWVTVRFADGSRDSDPPSPDSTPLDLTPGMDSEAPPRPSPQAPPAQAAVAQTVLLKTDPDLTHDPDPDRSADREAVALAMVTDLTKATGILPTGIGYEEGGQALPRKKQRKRPREDEKVCRVCGDKALAHNFDAITCESCKAFFRRNALRPGRNVCLFKGDCPVSVQTRRFCPSCRLKKCFTVGMKADLILDESERKARMNKVSENRARRLAKETTDSSESQVGSSSPSYTLVKAATMDSNTAITNSITAAPATSTVSTMVSQCGPKPQGLEEDGHHHYQHLPQRPKQQQQQQQEKQSAVSESSRSGMTTLHAVLTAAPAFSVAVSTPVLNIPNSGFPQRMASPSPAASPHPQTNNLPRQVNDHQQPFNIPSSLPQQLRSQPTLTAQDANNTHQDFQHVPRDLLPSDPHMYWRLSEEEKTLLTQLSSAYQDTIMTLPERVPFEGGGLVPGEHGEPLSVRSMESIFESSEKNTRQLIDFVQRLGDFHLLREDDKIAMLQASGMRSVILRWTALYVVERNTWLTRFGECSIAKASIIFGHEDIIREMAAFCRSSKIILKNDVTLFVLMQCLILFDPREPNLVDRQLINTFHDKYIILLKHYLESEYSFLYTERYLRAVMDKTVEIRGVADKCMGIMREFQEYVPPLMKQLLNLHDSP